MIKNDQQSEVKDKYYYLKSGVDAFKYFDCYHFNEDKLICENNVDLILEYEFRVRVYINDGIYICFNLLKLMNVDHKYYDYDDIKTKNTRYPCNFVNIMEKLQSILSTDPIKVFNLKNISDINKLEKIDHIKRNNVNILKDCFVEGRQSKIIAYLSERPDGPKRTLYESVSMYERALNVNISHQKTIKNVLFEDTNQKVQNIYNLYKSKNIDTILAIAHFRGGDFERLSTDWYVLTPQYYIDAVNILIKKVGVDKKIKILCSYHPSDVMFGGYVNIIKHNFSSIDVITENDFIGEYPDAKYIFMNETKHILFMSMFPNMILSNSTYAQIASDVNINLDKILIGTSKICYGSNQSYKYCGMTDMYTWDVTYIVFYQIYGMIKSGNIVYGKKYDFSTDFVNDFAIIPVHSKDIDEFATHITNMGKNFITLLINSKKINIQFEYAYTTSTTSNRKYYIVKEQVLTGGNIQHKILKYKQKLLFLTNITKKQNTCPDMLH